MTDTVKVKMDEVVNSIAMIAEYKAKSELRIATLNARVKELETGLAWYADANNSEPSYCEYIKDHGQRARALLAHRGG